MSVITVEIELGPRPHEGLKYEIDHLRRDYLARKMTE